MTPTRTCLLSALLLAGCRSFGPAQPATLARLLPMAEAAHIPPRFAVELTSPALTGEFDAVFAAADRGFALQLFPDLGGKVLDLRVGAASVDCETPAGSYHAAPPLDAARPHLALVFAAVLAELLAPVDGARVRGERVGADGRTEVDLAPALGSGRVVATLGDDGRVVAYRFELGWLAFRYEAGGQLRSSRFSGRFAFPGG